MSTPPQPNVIIGFGKRLSAVEKAFTEDAGRLAARLTIGEPVDGSFDPDAYITQHS